MIRSLVDLKIDPLSPQFTEVRKSPKTYTSTFKIGESVYINFDNRDNGAIELGAVDPIIGAPYYVIRPVLLGGARWFSIEIGIDASNIHRLGQVIPYLDIASPGSVSLHAVLRLHYKDGRSEDVSSAQIEIKRNRVNQTFPIALADLQSGIRQTVQRGTCIFFIEARDVELELYGFGMTGIDRQSVTYDEADIRSLRDVAKRDPAQARHKYAVIPTDNRVESRRHSGHAPLAEGVFIDFETSEGRAMDVVASAAGLTLQFENLQTAKWRNFEFRFDDIVNNGSMTALIRMVGSTHFDPALPNQNALLVVREYDENYKWSDTILDVPFRLSSKTGEQIALIDLYPVLSDARLRHRFGLLVFLPEQVTRVEIAEMEAFVYDRRTAGNSAP